METLYKTTATSETQPEPITEVRHDGPGLGFFAVGMVINIALIIAFFVWAYRQGRKKDE